MGTQGMQRLRVSPESTLIVKLKKVHLPQAFYKTKKKLLLAFCSNTNVCGKCSLYSKHYHNCNTLKNMQAKLTPCKECLNFVSS